jgi:hypothetical protein
MASPEQIEERKKAIATSQNMVCNGSLPLPAKPNLIQLSNRDVQTHDPSCARIVRNRFADVREKPLKEFKHDERTKKLAGLVPY